MKEILLNKVREEVEKEFGIGYTVCIKNVAKNNGIVLQSVNIREPGKDLTPNIYIDSLLVEINSGAISIREAAQEIISTYKNNKNEYRAKGLEQILSRRGILKRVTYQLINAEKNQERLRYMPHREFLDLAVVYRVILEEDGPDVVGFEVSNGICEKYGIEETELDCAARQNTEEGRFQIRRMKSIFAEIEGMSQEDAEIVGPVQMWVLSNARLVNGAAIMLYNEYFEKLAGVIGSDLYIMPSSIHEVIAIRDDVAEPGELRKMVQMINSSEVMVGEVLSGNVYRYSREDNKLVIA